MKLSRGRKAGTRAGAKHTRNIINHDSHRRIPNVTGDQTPKSLLAGRIPQLKPHCPIIEIHGLGEEINANGGGILGIKVVVHEAGYQGGFADGLFAEEDELELPQRIGERRVCHGVAGTNLRTTCRGVRRLCV